MHGAEAQEEFHLCISYCTYNPTRKEKLTLGLVMPWIFWASNVMKTTSDFPTTSLLPSFPASMEILWTKVWGSHGLTAVACDCQLLHEGLWGTSTRQSNLQAHLLVPLCWWHSWSGLMDQKNWMTSLTTLIAYIPTSNFPYRLSQMAHWVTPYTGRQPTLTSIQMLSHITIQQISILCYPPWHKELEQYVTRTASQETWNSSVLCSNNSYNGRQILCALNPVERKDMPREDKTDINCFLVLCWTYLQLH